LINECDLLPEKYVKHLNLWMCLGTVSWGFLQNRKYPTNSTV